MDRLLAFLLMAISIPIYTRRLHWNQFFYVSGAANCPVYDDAAMEYSTLNLRIQNRRGLRPWISMTVLDRQS